MEQRRIGVLGFDGVQALDFIGPCDAFASDVFTPDVFPPGAFGVTPRPAVLDELGVHGRP